MRKNIQRLWLIGAALFLSVVQLFSQQDSLALEKIRTESGVDPTRVQSRAGYTFLITDFEGAAGGVGNRLSMVVGVGRWSFSGKYEIISKTPGAPGEGFQSGAGDIRFSMLNAFYVKGRHALAGSAEFNMPTGKPGFGSQYFSVTPALTYSFTIQPSLIFAIQPQYTFDLMKDPLYPELSVLTIRSFLAKFTNTGYFFVLEPRPIIDFTNDHVNLILSPIIGRALGGGFNIIALAEIPVTQATNDALGTVYQFGFNKSF
jgi:hypothetical protein